MAILYVIKFLVAFCSIVYELLLAQALSAFLENTVLRFSVTIGLYLFSLGAGSWWAGRAVRGSPGVQFLKVEAVLTSLGGFGLLLIYCIGSSTLPRPFVSLCCHALIVAIGFATGFELPLLLELASSGRTFSEHRMLAADYAGALCGPILFAFYFYPVSGLLQSGFMVACLNACAGLLFFLRRERTPHQAGSQSAVLGGALVVLLVVVAVCWVRAGAIEDYVIAGYLR